MRLEEIMNREVETVSTSESAERAWERMRQGNIHHLVVVHGGKVVGVVSERDVGGSRGASLRRGRIVGHFMTGHVIHAAPTTTVRQAANMLRGYPIGCLPVMNNGRLAGIVTVSDLLELIGRGAARPVVKSKRWTLKHRGQGRKPTRTRKRR